MGFRLTLRTPSAIPLGVDGVLPERVANLSAVDVAKLPVLHGNRSEPLGVHFDVTTTPGDQLRFAGRTGNVHLIGRGMSDGVIVIEESVGRHTGAQMSGGKLFVGGAAGDWLGAEMTGGRIEVRGDGGNCVGAAYRGSRRGMTGGSILVRGDAGHEVGLLVRRGRIVVEGNTGEFTGAGMIAGTILVRGSFGGRAGAGMKRGTLLALGGVEEVSPGFRFSCEYEPAFLRMLWSETGWEAPGPTRVRCYRGDVLTGGKGELWLGLGERPA